MSKSFLKVKSFILTCTVPFYTLKNDTYRTRHNEVGLWVEIAAEDIVAVAL